MLEKLSRIIGFVAIEIVGVKTMQELITERLVSRGLWVVVGMVETEDDSEDSDGDLDVYRRALDDE